MKQNNTKQNKKTMKFLVLAIVCLSTVCIVDCNVKSLLAKRLESFNKFKSDYNVEYSSADEERLRFEIYARNVDKIEKFNEQNAGYTLEVNHFADRLPEEYHHRFGLKIGKLANFKNSPKASKYFESILKRNESVPDSIDWRTSAGRVSEVKNQGQCGSCWAFATTGLLEGQEVGHKLSKNKNAPADLTALSEQDLVDCSKKNYGCQGGLMNLALDDIAQLGGVESEVDYPYRGSNGKKCRFEQEKAVISDKGSYIIEGKDEEKLKEVVAKYGPVAVGIHAGAFKFTFYKKGVFYDKHCAKSEDSLNHGVLIVGYGTEKKGGDYWIVKNSWGPKYGEEGYIRMARNRDNMCGIALVPTIATF